MHMGKFATDIRKSYAYFDETFCCPRFIVFSWSEYENVIVYDFPILEGLFISVVDFLLAIFPGVKLFKA